MQEATSDDLLAAAASEHRSGSRRAGIVRGLSVAAIVAAVVIPLVGCDTGPGNWFSKARYDALCPRPQISSTATPQFGQQQAEIRALRQQAFRGDFFAQLELGRRYEGTRAPDRNLEDPVEAGVWYAMALSNPTGFTPVAAQLGAGRPNNAVARYDACRAFERRMGYGSLNRLLAHMSSDEQGQVRNRVIYVLSTQGADGFRTLARIHDDSFGAFGEPADNREAMEARGKPYQAAAPSVLNLFPRNDVDAYLYNYLAVQTGDVSAYVMLKDFERSSPERANFGGFVAQKAKRWVPPYEFYPPDAPDASGVPHSDESSMKGDVYEQALSRIDELPFVHIAEALTYLHVTAKPALNEVGVYPGDIQTFQAMLARPTTGRLAPIERVRAIQYAAVNGSSKAQLVLAVMYSEGVGVARDYARAYYWYAEADKQGNAEAKYAMSTYFSLGVSGIADQDKAKAVVYQLDAALAGFKPSIARLQQVLAQVSRANSPPRQPPYRGNNDYDRGDAAPEGPYRGGPSPGGPGPIDRRPYSEGSQQ
ncbi:MAG: hypothetical protein JWP35_2449 [Caulobacter sp.]|nr:hypothetical protein [Caulobacter sp.]